VQHGICVHALRAADGTRVKELHWRDTEDATHAEQAILEVLHEDQVGIHFSMEMIWGAQAHLSRHRQETIYQ
jgi:hypothetical protein